MPYMVTFTINIPQMLAFVYHTWILWVMRQKKLGKTPPYFETDDFLRRSRGDPQGTSSIVSWYLIKMPFFLSIEVHFRPRESTHESLVGGWATPLKNMKVNWDD